MNKKIDKNGITSLYLTGFSMILIFISVILDSNFIVMRGIIILVTILLLILNAYVLLFRKKN